MNIKNTKIADFLPPIIFLAVWSGIFFFAGFHKILLYPPQNIHFIRQTDCLSMVTNYYQYGFHFFQPQLFNLTCGDGRMVGEFPVLYYLTALIYLVVGEHEFILRLITLMIVLLGSWYLFRMITQLTSQWTIALILTFLFCSSTILFYYTVNYLPDASALGLVLIGWYFMFRYLDRGRIKQMIIAFIIFTIAALLKVTSFINPLAAALYLIFLNKNSGKQSHPNFFSKRKYLESAIFLMSMMLVIAWNIFAISYNEDGNCHYFLTNASPLWSLSAAEKYATWDHIYNMWGYTYYYPTAFHVMIILAVAGIILAKFADKRILMISLFMIIGGFSYFILFYKQFKNHDYYFITLIPVFIFSSCNGLVALLNRFKAYKIQIVMIIALLVVTALGINYSSAKIKERYKMNIDPIAILNTDFTAIRKYMDMNDPNRKNRIIIIPDHTQNGGLYLLRRPGWPVKDTTAAQLRNLNVYLTLGADYMVITDTSFSQNLTQRINGAIDIRNFGKLQLIDLKNIKH